MLIEYSSNCYIQLVYRHGHSVSSPVPCYTDEITTFSVYRHDTVLIKFYSARAFMPRWYSSGRRIVISWFSVHWVIRSGGVINKCSTGKTQFVYTCTKSVLNLKSVLQITDKPSLPYTCIQLHDVNTHILKHLLM